MNVKTPIIIDCDPGIDDIMMLLLALTHENLDVKLITTSAGNQTQDKTMDNALSFVSYLEKEVEVARGLSKPLFRELIVAAEVHGESGIGNVMFPESTYKESPRTAIQAMQAVLEEVEEPITIVATGPLTNVGALLLAHPELKPKIKEISIMGGCAKGGNVTPTAEFNIFVDPEAAEAVFQSGVPVIMSGLDVTHKAFLDETDLHRIREFGTELSQKLSSMLSFYKEAAKPSPFHEEDYEQVVRLHDLCAIGYVIDPTMFSGGNYYVKVECGHVYTAGTTIVDYKEKMGKKANAHVLYDVNREKLVGLFLEAFQIDKK